MIDWQRPSVMQRPQFEVESSARLIENQEIDATILPNTQSPHELSNPSRARALYREAHERPRSFSSARVSSSRGTETHHKSDNGMHNMGVWDLQSDGRTTSLFSSRVCDATGRHFSPLQHDLGISNSNSIMSDFDTRARLPPKLYARPC